MNKLIGLAAALALVACAGPESAFKEDPQHYALFVAVSNVYVDAPLTVKNADTGELIEIKTRHFGRDDRGYLVASLPPGRYTLERYSLDGIHVNSLETANGYFNVASDCFNYGGAYDFEVGSDGQPSYTNTTTLKDIEQLPDNIRKLARDRDICSAAMGKDSDRLKAADVQGQLALD
ncbi:MAG TPA: hypothetical protein VKT74_03355 [Gammaproteobacteria bacterium]|nr:hypothetical protein [Gammaproteobacteria bacterium]